jgi:rhombotail lipoprotein
MPELRVPLRVGLAFLPGPAAGGADGLDEAQKERVLERIRERFATRKFVADIIVIPDYYLANTRGFSGLQGVQRLYNIDLMALVSYDQVTHLDQNQWSLGYVTIVGAYVLRGSSQDTATLLDLAVVDPATRSLVLRAGGTDARHGTTTLIDEQRVARAANAESFRVASDQMIEHFDAALTRFEADVHAGKANVRVVTRGHPGGGGGGVAGAGELAGLFLAAGISARWRSRSRTAAKSSA